MTVLALAVAGLAAIAASLAVFWVMRRPSGGGMETLAAQLEALQKAWADQVRDLGGRLDAGLKESRDAVSTRMDRMADESKKVQGHLEALKEQTRNVQELGKAMAGLEQVLRPPKARGGLGELLLENLLSQMLPREHFGIQHGFRDGTKVDAVIRFKDWLLPIDSKFPLENFRRHVEAQSDADRLRAYKDFAADCAKHADKIAKTYIRPDEGTLDIALMYVPAENVYYHMQVPPGEFEGKPIMEAAWERRVVPVSPGTLFAYLQVILVGLRGMRMEEKAREIYEGLSRLRRHLEAFEEEYRKVGTHISNAAKAYEGATGRLERTRQSLPGPDEKPGELPPAG